MEKLHFNTIEDMIGIVFSTPNTEEFKRIISLCEEISIGLNKFGSPVRFSQNYLKLNEFIFSVNGHTLDRKIFLSITFEFFTNIISKITFDFCGEQRSMYQENNDSFSNENLIQEFYSILNLPTIKKFLKSF